MQAAHASQYSATNTTQKNKPPIKTQAKALSKEDIQITKRQGNVAQHHSL